MKNFSIKNLASEMTLEEQARLLFDDSMLRTRTRGKERVLTPQEEDAIVEDCRKKKQIPALNQLYRYNHTTGIALGSVLVAGLQLQLAISAFGTLVTGMTYTSQARDLMDSIMCLVLEKHPKILAEVSELWSVKHVFNNDYSIFEKVDGFPHSLQPNRLIQKAFVYALKCYKGLKQNLYIVEFLEQEGGMRFTDDEDEGVLKEAHAQLKRFEGMEDWLAIMHTYRSFYENQLMEGVTFEEELFKQLMLNPTPLFELSEEERSEAEETAKWHASK